VLFAVGGETGVSALRAATEAGIQSIGAERDQGAALASLAEKGLSVVTSVLGRSSFTVQELMRRVKNGDLADAVLSPVGYVNMDAVVRQSIIIEMDEILANLANGKIRTNVTDKKP